MLVRGGGVGLGSSIRQSGLPGAVATRRDSAAGEAVHLRLYGPRPWWVVYGAIEQCYKGFWKHECQQGSSDRMDSQYSILDFIDHPSLQLAQFTTPNARSSVQRLQSDNPLSQLHS